MKKTFKSVLSFLMILAVAFSFASVSVAEDSTVTFYGIEKGFGFAPGSEYTDSDLFDEFKNVYPGDSLTEEITVTNSSDDSDYIKLYIRAKAHGDENPLSEGVSATGETVATMAEFLSQLSMKVWLGDTESEPIYEASPDELDGFAESVYLGSIRKGETVKLIVELLVPKDLDNRFQFRVGEVDWVFTAELFDDPIPPVDTTFLTVHKVWDDDGKNRPGSVSVSLLRDGEEYAETVLDSSNGWTFTWGDLEEGYKWTVVENDIPEGYGAVYVTDGNIVTITNKYEKEIVEPIPQEPVSLTVKKQWSGDEDNLDDRPDSITATLFNGDEPVESVILGEWNKWTFSWDGLSADGDWKVIETNIPKGYVPSYSADGTVITITNVASLVQTGQMKWPIPVLAGTGIAMVLIGGFVILRKRRKEND